MFNVCPTCGLYEVERDVTGGTVTAALAYCSFCGAAIPFVRRRLFVVTGASGTGKSTTCQVLMQCDTGFLTLESDILFGMMDVSEESGLDAYWNVWLRMIKNIHQGPQSVILCGTVVPDRLERQPERRYIGDIHYLALVTEPNEQTRRLRSRPAWRESGDPEFIARHVDFNTWLTGHADAGDPTWDLLDTTSLSGSQCADAVLSWIADHPEPSAAATRASLS
jgi:hypothetical protein